MRNSRPWRTPVVAVIRRRCSRLRSSSWTGACGVIRCFGNNGSLTTGFFRAPDLRKIFAFPPSSVIMDLMSIREILKNNPLVLAPMAGITDLPFRLICKEMGAGLVFSEMVSVEALILEHKRTKGMLHTDPAERPVAFQIFGSKPESM